MTWRAISARPYIKPEPKSAKPSKGGEAGESVGSLSRQGSLSRAGSLSEVPPKSSKGGAVNGLATKQKPQARATQQWKAAEQRGRRLAIKPHTAAGQGGAGAGAHMPGMGYYMPGMGQTQTMTVNGQQVQAGGSLSTSTRLTLNLLLPVHSP